MLSTVIPRWFCECTMAYKIRSRMLLSHTCDSLTLNQIFLLAGNRAERISCVGVARA